MRVLYAMHVDWRWIKQRPHFLSEHLANREDIDLRVVYVPSWRRHRLTDNPSPVHRSALPVLPFRRLNVVRVVNRLLIFLNGARLDHWRPDVVIATSGEVADLLPAAYSNAPIVYDCMDLMTAFPGARNRVRAAESRLFQHAAAIIASSQHIASWLVDAYGAGKVPIVIRNGLERSSLVRLPERRRTNREINVFYFGTVSGWFDFDTILTCLHLCQDLRVSIVGPVDRETPKHPRLEFLGPRAHHELPAIVADADAFILPFVPIPLILGVDPVKLYEYLQLGRPVFARYYAEIERFKPFVFMYQSPGELIELIRKLHSSTLPAIDPSQLETFLDDADWSRRADAVANLLLDVLAKKNR